MIMKKILVTRKLLRESEEKASKIFDANFNLNDELYSQSKLVELSKDCDDRGCDSSHPQRWCGDHFRQR